VTAPLLAFRVAGRPVTQGNLRAVQPKGAKFARIIDKDQAKQKPWREAVRSTALEAAERAVRGAAWTPEAGPVRVDLWFALPAPASRPKRRRTWPIGKRSGDSDKLTRAVLDAITDAGVWGDDSQVVELRVVKDWPEHVQQMSPGVIVRIWRVDAEPPPPTTGRIPVVSQQIPGGSPA
jgi:Holliday junction resolvase RusA-like endonuclease